MYHQRFKDVYFSAVRFLTLPVAAVARLRYRNGGDDGYRLHLGCGPEYIQGMINIDGNIMRKKELWLDLRNRLPFPDKSASVVYCCHTLEHFFPSQAIDILKDIHRVLRDDGVARIAVPSMEHALAICRGEHEMNYPREFEDTYGQAINYLFCDGQHKFGYSFGVMRNFAQSAGFTRVTDYSAEHGVAPKSYGQVTLGDEPPGSLVVELAR